MARTKKIAKAKEPIRIRFKLLANGNKSIYFDIYKDGKRSYEFLKLYLVPEVNEAAKAQNANTLNAANAIKAQRIIELANSAAGLSNSAFRSKMLLTDWMRLYCSRKAKTGRSKSFSKQVDKSLNYLIAYKGDRITMRDVDKDFCKGFVSYLKEVKRSNGKSLSPSSVHCYYKAFNCALNVAVKEDIIPFNPFNKIGSDEKAQMPESTREYLTVEEVKALIKSECSHDAIKMAFLFGCFCGLRHSDIVALRWDNIETNGNEQFLRIVIKKTNKPLTMPLSSEALKWMPERGESKGTDKVFTLPKSEDYHNKILKRWAKDAGINKVVTFHVSRHTFATMELTAGADLYTTSKLLGHTNVKTTQIYAKIVDKKKAEAVNLVSSLFDE